MDSQEFESAMLADAAAGDADAKRELLALATDHLRRGLQMSDGLRLFLADGLLMIQCAVDPPRSKSEAFSQALALAAFGYEVAAPHRRANEEGRLLRDAELSAAVHLLVSDGIPKTIAVQSVASVGGTGAGEWQVWRACKEFDWSGKHGSAEQTCTQLLDALSETVRNEPDSYCEEVWRFFTVTRQA